ncbi:uncharacterized protein ACNLHF_023123 isoform 3-T3 [Anomaloglossus baeobatrachus]
MTSLRKGTTSSQNRTYISIPFPLPRLSQSPTGFLEHWTFSLCFSSCSDGFDPRGVIAFPGKKEDAERLFHWRNSDSTSAGFLLGIK